MARRGAITAMASDGYRSASEDWPSEFKVAAGIGLDVCSPAACDIDEYRSRQVSCGCRSSFDAWLRTGMHAVAAVLTIRTNRFDNGVEVLPRGARARVL